MKTLRAILPKLRGLFQRRTLKREIDDELRFHIEQRTAENIAAGMSPDEAAREARKRFGNLQAVREECRDRRGIAFGEQTFQDVRFGLRMLRKNPGFTAVAAMTLALGIGVNTSLFSAIQALLDRPLPYPHPESLVQLFQSSPGATREPHHSAPNFEDYRESGTFAFLAALNDKQFNLVNPGEPAERVPGLLVSLDFFALLGIQPELGRAFMPEEGNPGNDNVVVLDHGFWERRFAGDPNVIGRVLRLDGEPVTVIGVMPARFRDPMLAGATYLWRPITFTEAQRQQRGHQFLKCIARLNPGTSLREAQARSDVLAKRQIQKHPENSPHGLRLEPLAKSSLHPVARTITLAIMTLGAFVLLIACANLANLQYARTALRSREFAIRFAMGGSRRRLLQQLLVESLLLATLGGALGLVFAQWSNQLLSRQFVVGGERILNLTMNWPVLSFAFAASTLSGLAFGLMPAWFASRTDAGTVLKQSSHGVTGSRSQHRIQHSLVIAQVALALMLLTGAGLVVNGFYGFAELDPGWQVGEVSLGYLTLPEVRYGSCDSLRAFADRLEEKLKSMPGVEQAALCWNLPLRQFNVTSSFVIAGRPEPPKGTLQQCSVNGITPGYFETLGMHVLSGRNFSSMDTASRPAVVIINEAMARAFWPGQSPIGQHVNDAEIVGVVNNVRFPGNPAEPNAAYQSYRPFAQEPRGSINIAVRGKVGVDSLRRVVAEMDQDLPVGQPGPALAEVENSLGHWAIGGKVLSLFALLGLSLAALGIYGVISGFVARRTGEIGVRMALGAQIGDVLWLVIGKGLRLALLGMGIGLIGGLGMGRLLARVLPELPGHHTWVLLAAALFLFGITLLACWFPARRAARIDPMGALRAE